MTVLDAIGAFLAWAGLAAGAVGLFAVIGQRSHRQSVGDLSNRNRMSDLPDPFADTDERTAQ